MPANAGSKSNYVFSILRINDIGAAIIESVSIYFPDIYSYDLGPNI